MMQTQGRLKIAAVGVFDGVHRGHRALLESLRLEARLRGLSSLAITFDRHPLEVIAPERAPLMLSSASERMELLKDCGLTNVVLMSFDPAMRCLTAKEFMARIRDQFGVQTLYMGFNHNFGSDRISDIESYRQIAHSLGMEIVRGSEALLPDGSKVSSSLIRQQLQNGDVCAAAQALGRNYNVDGTVVDGKKLGRQIGFPTANLHLLSERKLLPTEGVYACWCTLADGSRQKAMVNIGRRPTVDSDGAQSVEAHLIDFNSDLYGQQLRLDFVERIRQERKFPSVEALRSQLEADASILPQILK